MSHVKAGLPNPGRRAATGATVAGTRAKIAQRRSKDTTAETDTSSDKEK